ncbi:hypothetical protein A4H97_27990 [Niastella yeongjuensis]|uniref:DUF4267 domain-containing protein n=1 Tax=Niastella yeongjuensis TaxID=354355 RepID=A0A1V9EV53_9BACT|nr:DUF4267 domain-containing protein [Niastella yeongjuensis]OQP49735.1 hypothetical protein A4H97_27990 [Niastella yeongjuensis]SEP40748.1 protein of unknown function [Niastella yeongjuensis]
MKKITHTIAYWICLLTGLGLIFIGARFFFVPVAAEHAFGIQVNTGSNFSFHYIKGIRDIFSGLILTALLLARQYRALGILSLCAVIIPATDMSIVALQPTVQTAALYPHLSAVIIAILLGIYYIRVKVEKKV